MERIDYFMKYFSDGTENMSVDMFEGYLEGIAVCFRFFEDSVAGDELLHEILFRLRSERGQF